MVVVVPRVEPLLARLQELDERHVRAERSQLSDRRPHLAAACVAQHQPVTLSVLDGEDDAPRIAGDEPPRGAPALPSAVDLEDRRRPEPLSRLSRRHEQVDVPVAVEVAGRRAA